MAGEAGLELHQRRVEYENTIRLSLQQAEGLIWPHSTPHTVSAADGLRFDEIAPFQAPQLLTSKYQEISIKELSFTHRWLQTAIYHDEYHWPEIDLPKSLSDPQSAVFRQFANNFMQLKDALAVAALFGPIKRGLRQPGDIADEVFDATNQVVPVNLVESGTAAATGLNRAKLNMAFAMFKRNYAPPGEKYMAIGYLQLIDLLINESLNDKMSILGQFSATGMLRYLDINFVSYENLPKTGSNRRCPMWMAEGLRTGTTQAVKTNLDPLVNIVGRPWQATVLGEIGAARVDNKLVVEVLCLEA